MGVSRDEPEADGADGATDAGAVDRSSESSAGEGDDSSLTEGRILRPLFQLAWPIVVLQLLQVSYNFIDTVYLGRLSTDAVGAISLAFPLVFLLISIASGFTAAGAILVAQHTGAEGNHSVTRVTGQTMSFVVALSVVISVVGYLYTRPALELLPSSADTATAVIPLAAAYMEIVFLGVPLIFGFYVFAALMRGYGDTRTPMFVMVLSVVANVALNPVLIFGFEGNPLFGWLGLRSFESTLHAMTGFAGMGIEGAAVATVVARGGGTVLAFWVLFGTDIGPAVGVGHLVPDAEILEDIVRLGVPSMVEKSMSALAMIALTAIVVTFSPAVVAAYGLGNRLISIVFLPAMGVGRAIDTMVGQNVGANRPDRAARSVWRSAAVTSGVMALLAVAVFWFADSLIGVFVGDVPNALETVQHGATYVRTRTAEFLFIGVSQVVLGAFRGAGNTKIAMGISFVTLWVGRVGSVFLLALVLDWGATGVWVGMAVGNVLGSIVGAIWFSLGTWRERYVETA